MKIRKAINAKKVHNGDVCNHHHIFRSSALNIAFSASLVFGIESISAQTLYPEQSNTDRCELSDDISELLQLHNQAREKGTKCGHWRKQRAAPLKWNCELATVAQAHSQDMFDNTFLSHSSSSGLDIVARVNKTDYDWRSIAENVANGYTSAQDVNSSWLNSPAHCDNITNQKFIHVGAARVGSYWTVVFGRDN